MSSGFSRPRWPAELQISYLSWWGKMISLHLVLVDSGLHFVIYIGGGGGGGGCYHNC